MTDLIQRLVRRPRDEQLWSEFYRACYPAIHYLLFHLGEGDVDLAEELAQETLVSFFTSHALERVPDEESALAYLRVTARNLFRDHRRKQSALKRDVARRVPLDDEEHRLASEHARQTFLLTELEQDLQVLAKELSDEERRLLQMTIEGRTLREIAGELGISYSAAAVRLHRLRARLGSL